MANTTASYYGPDGPGHKTFEEVRLKLAARLALPGPIKTGDTWTKYASHYGYSVFCSCFSNIMQQMVEAGLAEKIRAGQWEIRQRSLAEIRAQRLHNEAQATSRQDADRYLVFEGKKIGETIFKPAPVLERKKVEPWYSKTYGIWMNV